MLDTISCPSGKDTLLACSVLQSIFSSRHPLAYIGAWGCSFPDTGLHTSPCWTSWCSHEPLSPACPDGNTTLWVCQPLFPVCVASKLAEGALLRACPSGYSSPYPEMIKEDERYQSPWNCVPFPGVHVILQLLWSVVILPHITAHSILTMVLQMEKEIWYAFITFFHSHPVYFKCKKYFNLQKYRQKSILIYLSKNSVCKHALWNIQK